MLPWSCRLSWCLQVICYLGGRGSRTRTQGSRCRGKELCLVYAWLFFLAGYCFTTNKIQTHLSTAKKFASIIALETLPSTYRQTCHFLPAKPTVRRLLFCAVDDQEARHVTILPAWKVPRIKIKDLFVPCTEKDTIPMHYRYLIRIQVLQSRCRLIRWQVCFGVLQHRRFTMFILPLTLPGNLFC